MKFTESVFYSRADWSTCIMLDPDEEYQGIDLNDVDEIVEWCRECIDEDNIEIDPDGTRIQFKNKEDFMLFTLRWA